MNNLDNAPIWAVFGDLMAGLVGIFVLLLLVSISFQFELTRNLAAEIDKREMAEQEQLFAEDERKKAEQQRQIAEQKRSVLEDLLSEPLLSGRITLRDGRIGISGSILFALNSAELQNEGRELLQALVKPLTQYLQKKQELLMVSGFTDDLPVKAGNQFFRDNWELSAQRSLTVTRHLIAVGMPADKVFAAAFGEQQPIIPNEDAGSRAQNRRVEITPVPALSNQTSKDSL